MVEKFTKDYFIFEEMNEQKKLVYIIGIIFIINPEKDAWLQ